MPQVLSITALKTLTMKSIGQIWEKLAQILLTKTVEQN